MKLLFLLFILFNLGCIDLKEEQFFFKKGDLLFQDLDSSPICYAIEQVTPGYQNKNFSHIAMVMEIGDSNNKNNDYRYNDHVKLIEAWPGGVHIISIDSFLQRSFDNNNRPKVIVGRIKDQYQHVIKNGLKFAKNQIGSDYDDIFLINNNAYYCSELIYKAFEKDSLFSLAPMTFSKSKKEPPLKEWEEYYFNLGVPIPEGKLGINPGLISISKKIQIVHHYGLLSKKKN